MPRGVFFSFHYKADNQRAAQIRNIGVVEGNSVASDNAWEAVTRGGDPAIQRWIADQMRNRTCTVVLVGAETARRKWIDYEIIKSWEGGMGVVGVCIHNLKNLAGQPSAKGENPFAHLALGQSPFSSIVKLYDPAGRDSKQVYASIATNLEGWIEEAIRIRQKY